MLVSSQTKSNGNAQSLDLGRNHMTSAAFWHLFQETGDPMHYLLYKEALALEQTEDKTA